MNNITFKYNKPLPKNKHNVLSVSVFRLRNSYKSTDEYYKGLKLLSNIFTKMFPEYYLYVFYDKSAIHPLHDSDIINEDIKNKWIPLFSKLNNHPKIRLIQYEHKNFVSNIYHEGLFGVFTRFMPIFDYKFSEHINQVIVLDVDSRFHFIKNITNALKIFNKSKSNFHFRTKYCYYTRHRFADSEDNLEQKYKPDDNVWQRILAGSMMSKIKFPKKLLNDFIDCTKNLKNENCSYITNFSNVKPLDHYDDYTAKQHEIFKGSVYKYGIDEFFLNTTFLKYIIDQIIPFSYTIDSDIHGPIQNIYFRNSRFSDTSSKNKYFKELIKVIMGTYYDDNVTLSNNYLLYRKLAKANKDARLYMHVNLLKFAKNIIAKDINYKNYGFTKEEIKCVSRHSLDEKYLYNTLFKEYRYK